MWVIVDAIMAIAGILSVIGLVGTAKGRGYVQFLVDNIKRGNFAVLIPQIGDLSTQLKTVVDAMINAVRTYGGPIQTDLETVFAPFAKSALDSARSILPPGGRSTPANAQDTAAAAFAQAFSFGIASAGVTAAFEAVTPEKLNTLNGIGPMLAQLSGFRDVASWVLGPLYRWAFGESINYQYAAQFRPRILDIGAARSAFRRRFISQAQFEQILAYNGLSPDWVATEEQVAYTPVNARLMLAAIDDTAIDPNLIKPFLRDAGYAESQLDALVGTTFFRATKTIRHETLTATIENYVAGFRTDADLQQALTFANIGPGSGQYYLAAAREKRLKVLTEDYKRGWDAKFLAGEIAVNDYRVALSGLGYTAPVIDAIVGMQSAKLDAHEFAQEQAIERAQRRKDQEIAIQSALAGFKERKLDVVALTAALVAAQLPAETVALYVALAEARGQVAQHTTKVTRTASQNLAIKAASEEYFKGLINTAQYEQQLKNAGMSEADILNEVAYQQARGAQGVALDTPQPTP